MIATNRLILRPFRDADRAPNAEIFADPAVRRFALERLDRAAADARLDHFVAGYEQQGLGMFAVEDRRDGTMIGQLGLAGFSPELHALIPSHPSLQIAWQLARRVWGQGLATEGARAVLDRAWTLGKAEVVAITSAINTPSRRVMEKLGMQHVSADDFQHPDMPAGHPLAPHVLYRISR